MTGIMCRFRFMSKQDIRAFGELTEGLADQGSTPVSPKLTRDMPAWD